MKIKIASYSTRISLDFLLAGITEVIYYYEGRTICGKYYMGTYGHLPAC